MKEKKCLESREFPCTRMNVLQLLFNGQTEPSGIVIGIGFWMIGKMRIHLRGNLSKLLMCDILSAFLVAIGNTISYPP